MNKKTLIKTDKNGTKYYHNVCTCGKCGGNGYIAIYCFNEGGLCFDCDGRGIIEYQTKEYTPEYEKKLEERRRKKEEKKLNERKAKADELNKEFYARNGFDQNGKCYVALGNTYQIKDELKAKGFCFKNEIGGWYSSVEVDGIETVEMSVSDIYETDNAGVYKWEYARRAYFIQGEVITDTDVDYCDSWDFNGAYLLKLANKKYESKSSQSEFVGNVGDKIEVAVKVNLVVDCSYRLNAYTKVDTDLLIMNDEKGNVITWKTSSYPNLKIDGKTHYIRNFDGSFKIIGTVKEHTTYNGVKQTVLTRCKVKEV